MLLNFLVFFFLMYQSQQLTTSMGFKKENIGKIHMPLTDHVNGIKKIHIYRENLYS